MTISEADVEIARILAILGEREKQVEERAISVMREVALATKALEHRLENLNNWATKLNEERLVAAKQLAEERSRFVTRAELVAALVTTAALATVLLRTLRVF